MLRMSCRVRSDAHPVNASLTQRNSKWRPDVAISRALIGSQRLSERFYWFMRVYVGRGGSTGWRAAWGNNSPFTKVVLEPPFGQVLHFQQRLPCRGWLSGLPVAGVTMADRSAEEEERGAAEGMCLSEAQRQVLDRCLHALRHAKNDSQTLAALLLVSPDTWAQNGESNCDSSCAHTWCITVSEHHSIEFYFIEYETSTSSTSKILQTNFHIFILHIIYSCSKCCALLP